jgi:hypothetical protein
METKPGKKDSFGGIFNWNRLVLEFPMINNYYTGVHHSYAYAQIVDSLRSGGASKRGMAKTHFYNTNSMKIECIFFCLYTVMHHDLTDSCIVSGSTS